MVEMKTINCCIQLTPAEIIDIKAVTGKTSTRDAVLEAVEYRIMHAPKKPKEQRPEVQ